MAAHSSILAWKIPWTEETARLPSMVPQSHLTEHMHGRCHLSMAMKKKEKASQLVQAVVQVSLLLGHAPW